MHGNCYRSWNLSSNFVPYPHQQLGETKSLSRMDSARAQWWPKSHAYSSCYPCAALEKWKQCIPASHFNGKVIGCIHFTLSWNDRMLNGVPKRHWGKKLHAAVRVLWKSCTSCSSGEIDLWLTIQCQLVQQSMAYIAAHSYRIWWGWLFAVNNQNCLSIVSFCSRTMQHLVAIVMCKICCNGLRPGGIVTSSLLSRSRPTWLLVVCACESTSSG